MKVNLKILEASALLAMLIAIILSVNSFDEKCMGIEGSVLRLHIIANSDSNTDQEIKLLVRDEIISKSRELFDESTTKKAALSITQKNLNLFRETAEKTLREHGFDYEVRAEIGKTKFPTRTYSDVTLPAGNYDALRIVLGEGKGKNWWCIMFPALCISAASKKSELDDILSKEESELVKGDPRFEIRFWIVEKLRELK